MLGLHSSLNVDVTSAGPSEPELAAAAKQRHRERIRRALMAATG